MENTTVAVGVPTRRRTLLQRGLEVAVSLLFLGLALRGVQLADLWNALRRADYLWLLPAVGFTVGILLVKGVRWRLLFYPEHRLPFGTVFSALCAGYLASNVLPARLGEVVRALLLASEEPVSIARTVSSIIVERLLDVLTLLAIMVVMLPFVELPVWMTRSAQGLGILALVGSAAMVLLSFWKERLLRWAHALLRHVRFLDRPGVYDALGHIVDGFATLRGRLGLMLIALSFLAWAGVVAMAWSVAQALGLGLPLAALVLAVVVTSLGMVVPSSPGYIGVFHYLTTVALAPFGVAKDVALGFALVWHGVNYLTLTAAGVIALWVHGTSLSQVLRWRDQQRIVRASELADPRRGGDSSQNDSHRTT